MGLNLGRFVHTQTGKIMMSVLLGLGVSVFLHWYFNIRSQSKCILLNNKCDTIKCIKQKNN